jgi:hypothetical protein
MGGPSRRLMAFNSHTKAQKKHFNAILAFFNKFTENKNAKMAYFYSNEVL